MVTKSIDRSFDAMADAFADFELTTIAVAGSVGVGGLLLAQELADQVLPMFNFPLEPSQPGDLLVSALVKLAGAVLVATGGLMVGGNLAWLGGGLAASMSAHAFLDVVDVVQRGGVPGNAPSTPAISNSPTPTPTPTPTPASGGQIERRASAGGSRSEGWRGT